MGADGCLQGPLAARATWGLFHRVHMMADCCGVVAAIWQSVDEPGTKNAPLAHPLPATQPLLNASGLYASILTPLP